MDEQFELTTNSLSRLAAQIKHEHEAALRSARTALEHAFRAGQLLIQAKALVAHGEWLPWLAENVAIGERQAQKYMRLATNRSTLESNTTSGTDLTITDALELITQPKPEPDYIGSTEFRAAVEKARQALRACLEVDEHTGAAAFEVEVEELADPEQRRRAYAHIAQDWRTQELASWLSRRTGDGEFESLATRIWLRAKWKLAGPGRWTKYDLMHAMLELECNVDSNAYYSELTESHPRRGGRKGNA